MTLFLQSYMTQMLEAIADNAAELHNGTGNRSELLRQRNLMIDELRQVRQAFLPLDKDGRAHPPTPRGSGYF